MLIPMLILMLLDFNTMYRKIGKLAISPNCYNARLYDYTMFIPMLYSDAFTLTQCMGNQQTELCHPKSVRQVWIKSIHLTLY